MSPQADFIVSNGTGAAVRSDLNVQFAAIVSNNSGATEPATMYAYQWWADTTTGLLKLRNSANSAWIELRQLDGEFTTVPVEDGSAGAPSIYFKTSGTDTGLYSPGADQVGISTGGTARVIVDSNGATLNGQGDLRFADSDSSHFIALQAPATITTNVTLTLPSADGTSGQFISTDGSGTLSFATPASGASNLADGSAATPSVNYSADTNTGIFRAGNDLLAFSTGGTQRAQFDDSGRLLVGTSTARNNYFGSTNSAFIQVEGTSFDSSGLSLTSNNTNNDYTRPILSLNKSNGTGVGSNTLVDNGTKLGEIYFQGNDGTHFEQAASISAFVDGTPGANDMPGRLVFSTTADGASSPTERMRIGSSDVNNKAFVSIRSTTVPHTDNCTLYVRCAATNSFSGITLQDGGGDLVNRDFLRFYDYLNNKVGAIYRSGSSTVYATSSDYRLKENVVPLSNALSRLMSVSVHRFNFIAHPDTTVDGFLAHEIQTVVPEAVGGEKDAVDSDGNPLYQCIDQSKLVPLLTAALQEAIGEIESLKARVAALESA